MRSVGSSGKESWKIKKTLTYSLKWCIKKANAKKYILNPGINYFIIRF